MQLRRAAETDVAETGEFQRAIFGTVIGLDLLQPRDGGIGFHFRRDPPRRRRAIVRLGGRGHRHRDRALEARSPLGETEQAVEIDRQRALPGFDADVNAGSGVVRHLARGDPERIADSADHGMAVAAHRAGQRTNIAAEGDILQFQRAEAHRVMQRDASGQVQPVDRQRPQIELAARGRPIDPAPGIEPEIERHAVDGELVGAPFATHQGAEAELDVELVGANLAEILDATDRHRAQPQRRRRQQPCVERAGHPHRHADDRGWLRPRTAAGTGSSR